MTDKLKPCPFCGGKAIRSPEVIGCGWHVIQYELGAV